MLFLYLILILLAAVTAACFFLYRFALYTPNRKQNDDHNVFDSQQYRPYLEQIHEMIDTLNARPYETVQIRSFDGLALYGRYYHVRDGAPLAICFHGYRGTPSRDFAGGTKMYLQEGNNLLLIEQRGHKRSEGHRITLGVKERLDCLAWAHFGAELAGEGVPVMLAGISMGAATVLMASELDLPASVKAIVADCPYTTPMEIMLKVARGMHVPRFLGIPLIYLMSRVFGGFSPTAADTREAVRHAHVPILLIHGEDDHFVPCDMSREIAAAAPDLIEFHTFPGAGHGFSYLIDPARYETLLHAFCERTMH